MKPVANLSMLLFLLTLFQGCNTLYNTSTINIEIIEPGKIHLSPNYKTIAIKYNNCNVDINPLFAAYHEGNNKKTDTINTDSIASKIYYNQLVNHLNEQDFFDSIIVLKPTNYSGVKIMDTLNITSEFIHDTIPTNRKQTQKELVSTFASLININSANQENQTKYKALDSEFGLYSKQEIVNIADSTNADILFSLDYYYSIDIIKYIKRHFTGIELVQVVAFWNIYDLQNHTLLHFHTKTDTISWSVSANNLKQSIQLLPPRKDAILNASHIAATKFAEYLIPHWIEVKRMYYVSGHVDIKKTEKLISENRWIEASNIWKANVNNPNKKIAAKCKFNMGLVCEMEGDLDAAVDWVVKSFEVFGSKNEQHYHNCLNYINILNLRKNDLKKINSQYNNLN